MTATAAQDISKHPSCEFGRCVLHTCAVCVGAGRWWVAPPCQLTVRSLLRFVTLRSSCIVFHNPTSPYIILYCHGNGADLGLLCPMLYKVAAHSVIHVEEESCSFFTPLTTRCCFVWRHICCSRPSQLRTALHASVIAYEYPGYGINLSATSSESSLIRDANAVFDYLVHVAGCVRVPHHAAVAVLCVQHNRCLSCRLCCASVASLAQALSDWFDSCDHWASQLSHKKRGCAWQEHGFRRGDRTCCHTTRWGTSCALCACAPPPPRSNTVRGG